jgi:hypothetical protein
MAVKSAVFIKLRKLESTHRPGIHFAGGWIRSRAGLDG